MKSPGYNYPCPPVGQSQSHVSSCSAETQFCIDTIHILKIARNTPTTI